MPGTACSAGALLIVRSHTGASPVALLQWLGSADVAHGERAWRASQHGVD